MSSLPSPHEETPVFGQAKRHDVTESTESSCRKHKASTLTDIGTQMYPIDMY